MAINVLELHKLMKEKYHNEGGVKNYNLAYGDILRKNTDGARMKEKSRSIISRILSEEAEPYRGIPFVTGQIYRLGNGVGVVGEPMEVTLENIPLPVTGDTTMPHATISLIERAPGDWDAVWKDSLAHYGFKVNGNYISKNAEMIPALVVDITDLIGLKKALYVSIVEESLERPARFEKKLYELRTSHAGSLIEEAKAKGIIGGRMG